MALVSEISGEESNSYIAVVDADTYFEDSLNADPWTTASAETKAKALVSATRLIDAKYEWLGTKSDDNQSLAWPRWSVADLDGWTYDSDELPKRLLDATCELALSLLSGTDATFADPGTATAGIASVKAGSVSVVFDKDDRPETIPDAVADLLRHLVVSDRDSTFRQVSLLRT